MDTPRRYAIVTAFAAIALPACAQTTEELCRREVNRLQQSCEGTTALRQCWRERLSAACFKEADAGTGVKTASCKREMERVAGPCQQASASSTKRCVAENLSPSCKETAAKAEQARKACEDAVQRVWQRCKAEPEAKQAQCFEQQRPAASAECK